MGRRAEGWRVKSKRGWFYVHFTHEKVAHRISLGTRDAGEASRLAASEYAAVVSGRRRSIARKVGTLLALDELLVKWISSLEGSLDETTRDTLEIYARKYIGFFGSLDRITEASCGDYGRARLRQVLRKTAQKELSYLRGFLDWCREQGALSATPHVPSLPKKATGKRAGKQRATPVEINEEQALAIISVLPALSKKIDGRKWPIRDRYRFAWETGLRPETVARVRAPENWTRGSNELRLDNEDDKARYGRVVPLTPIAVRMLAGSVPKEGGVIFGHHNFNKALKAAAKKVLGEETAKRFAQYDFRHGRVTHLLDEGASLTGAAFLVGHKQLTTTNRYSKPNRRAAERALAAVGAPFPPPPSEPPTVKASQPENSGVTDGVRTRDNWSHNAADKHDPSGNRAGTSGQEGSKNAPESPGFRTGCGNSAVDRAASGIALLTFTDSLFDALIAEEMGIELPARRAAGGAP